MRRSASLLGAILIGGALFFFFPRFSAGYLGRTSMQPSLMTGFSDDVELGQIGEIKKNLDGGDAREDRQAGGLPATALARNCAVHVRWKALVDAESSPPQRLRPMRRVGFTSPIPSKTCERPAIELHYEILVQPMATDAMFAPANAVSILGGFSGENPTASFNARRTYLFRDFTGSLFNPFRNYAPVRYYGYSRLPAINAAKLRAASTDYPDEIRDIYLQLPALDPRIAELAQRGHGEGANAVRQGRSRSRIYLRIAFHLHAGAFAGNLATIRWRIFCSRRTRVIANISRRR